LISFFRRRRTHRDFADEIEAHLDLETDRLIADGWSRDRAQQEARRAFGNVALAKERFYETSRWVWLEQLAQDLRYAWRTLRHSPSFCTTTMLTLMVAIGLATVAFTVFNAYVLRPYAVRTPSSLYQIGWRSPTSGGVSFRWNDYVELSNRHDLFDDVVAETTRFISSDGQALAAVLVSGNYFDGLGPRVLLGRAFTAADGEAIVVLSHQAWRRLYNGAPDVIGKELALNGQYFTIVGVLRPEFTGLGGFPQDVWVPLTAYAPGASPDLVGGRQTRTIELIARIREGVSPAQATARLSSFIQHAVDAPPGEQAQAFVQPASPNPFSVQMLALLSPIFAAFALVLVTACANVSNVMLARGVARQREIAVRLSLGASRSRVVRQLVTEGLLIALAAGVGAVAFARVALRAALMTFFGTLPASVAGILRIVPLDLDYRVFMFAMTASMAATVMFALMPALQTSRLSLIDGVRGTGGSVRHGSRLRHVLVIGQVAVSVILVTLAVTLARNGAAVGSIDLGFQSAGLVSINVRGEHDDLIRRLVPVLAADPRVAEVAATGGNPLFIRTRSVAAAPAGASAAHAVRYTFVAPEYFAILRVPIVRGRGFLADEARSAAPVAIVSASTARAFWPGQDPIGKTIRIERPQGRPVDEIPGYTQLTVVGTAPDVVSGLIVDGRDSGHIYLPVTADDAHATAALVRGRTPGDLGPEALQTIFRRVATDPEVFESLPLNEMRDLQVYPLRAASWVGFLLGVLALGLSVSGLYGVLIYTVNQRTREIGIRVALGATGAAVVRLIVKQSARLAGIGAAIGLIVAFGGLKALTSVVRLQTLSLLDATAFAAAAVMVVGAAVLAAYQPARRATRIDPSQALRADN
jgi:predicted permease